MRAAVSDAIKYVPKVCCDLPSARQEAIENIRQKEEHQKWKACCAFLGKWREKEKKEDWGAD
jgi:hypothetical protein